MIDKLPSAFLYHYRFGLSTYFHLNRCFLVSP
jgi:hypothetical protein